MAKSLELVSNARKDDVVRYVRDIIAITRKGVGSDGIVKADAAIHELADAIGVRASRIRQIFYGRLDFMLTAVQFSRFQRAYAEKLDSEIVAAIAYAQELCVKRARLPQELGECSNWSALIYGSPAVMLATRSVAQL